MVRASAEVHWQTNKDEDKELHKFIFILQDNRRQTILLFVDTQRVLNVGVTDQQVQWGP